MKTAKVVISIKITTYYPSDKDAVIRLNQTVARIHAEVVGSYIQKINIATDEWDDVLKRTKEMLQSHRESVSRRQKCI